MGGETGGGKPAPLPRYRCHKVVEAAKIDIVHHDASTGIGHLTLDVLNPHMGTRLTMSVPAGWVARHKPEVGGYYVRYEDGYESFSPAAAFESGYTKLGAQVNVPPAQPATGIVPLGQLPGQGHSEG